MLVETFERQQCTKYANTKYYLSFIVKYYRLSLKEKEMHI
jgi:hypothetical protein